jgi:hypothetical protein
MPGFYYNTVNKASISFIAGLHTGPALAQWPEYTITGKVNVSGYEGEGKGKRESKWSLAIASYIYAGLKFSMGKKTDLVVNAGYNHLKPTFEKTKFFYEQWTRDPGDFTQALNSSSEQTYTQAMNTIQIGAGLLVKL